jgi:hypothetical protein
MGSGAKLHIAEKDDQLLKLGHEKQSEKPSNLQKQQSKAQQRRRELSPQPIEKQTLTERTASCKHRPYRGCIFCSCVEGLVVEEWKRKKLWSLRFDFFFFFFFFFFFLVLTLLQGEEVEGEEVVEGEEAPAAEEEGKRKVEEDLEEVAEDRAPKRSRARDMAEDLEEVVDSASLGQASVLPTKMSGLRSCLVCKLVKNDSQFEERGCDNCDRYVRLQGDRERVHAVTTTRFRFCPFLGFLFILWFSQWFCRFDGKSSLLGSSLHSPATKLCSCNLFNQHKRKDY